MIWDVMSALGIAFIITLAALTMSVKGNKEAQISYELEMK